MIRWLAASILPPFAKRALKRTEAERSLNQVREGLRRRPLRIVLGASGKFQDGWVATDADQLNLLAPDAWATLLQPSSVDAMLAEHVWEHLTLEQGVRAATLCFRYLKPGAYIRVAVPDGLHPDPDYREYIKVGGAGGGAVGGHLVSYDYRSLVGTFEAAGFTTRLLEYHDDSGNLVATDWDPADGMIRRSRRFDPRGAVSIVLDAFKGE